MTCGGNIITPRIGILPCTAFLQQNIIAALFIFTDDPHMDGGMKAALPVGNAPHHSALTAVFIQNIKKLHRFSV